MARTVELFHQVLSISFLLCSNFTSFYDPVATSEGPKGPSQFSNLPSSLSYSAIVPPTASMRSHSFGTLKASLQNDFPAPAMCKV